MLNEVKHLGSQETEFRQDEILRFAQDDTLSKASFYSQTR